MTCSLCSFCNVKIIGTVESVDIDELVLRFPWAGPIFIQLFFRIRLAVWTVWCCLNALHVIIPCWIGGFAIRIWLSVWFVRFWCQTGIISWRFRFFLVFVCNFDTYLKVNTFLVYKLCQLINLLNYLKHWPFQSLFGDSCCWIRQNFCSIKISSMNNEPIHVSGKWVA